MNVLTPNVSTMQLETKFVRFSDASHDRRALRRLGGVLARRLDSMPAELPGYGREARTEIDAEGAGSSVKRLIPVSHENDDYGRSG
jgi:hypothetical protein